MAQIVASTPYCLESSTQLTRPSSNTFYRIDGSQQPTIIDKHQAKRLYRLQRTPIRNAQLHLDNADVHYDAQGYFDSVLQKELDRSANQSTASIYHQPNDMSNDSLARFSFGKARLDPQRLVPNKINTMRIHPLAATMLR
jgi:hypothetical protein